MRRVALRFLPAIALAITSGCVLVGTKIHPGAAPQTAAANSAKTPGEAGPYPFDTKEYVIGVSDVIVVHVFPTDDPYPSPLVVGPDGKITLPSMGEVVAAGKTREQLAKDIAEALTKAGIKDPQVDVILQQSNSKRFYIEGEVRAPGAKPWIIPKRVLEALVEAGGFNEFADTKHIIINRGNGATILKFNYNDVIKGKHPEQNVWVEPDDIIVVK